MSTTQPTSANQTKNKFSISGWESYFDLGDDTIKVWGSTHTGLERVYLNGQLVSEKRNWRFNSNHVFPLNGRQIEVKIIVVSMLSGKVRLEIWQDSELLDSDELSMDQVLAGTPFGRFKPQSFASWLVFILLFGGTGAVVGFLVAILLK